MIPLMRNTFINEIETKEALIDFILKTQRLSMDQQCFAFEKAFAKYQNSEHAILFNSGGSANLALLQALKNLGRLHPGDKIGFSALTWSTNTMPIIQLGFEPIAVDCEPTTLNVMSEHLENCLKNHRLRVMFITNALGFTGDLNNIRKICQENDVILLEDNCESLGTTLPEGRAGSFGLASTFSFFVAHHMSTIEGGMVCTDDGELAEMLVIARANGWDRNLSSEQQVKWRKKHNISSEFEAKYTFYDLGYNLRPTEITGFLGLYQLQFVEEMVNRREENYSQIETLIKQNSDILLLEHSHIEKLSAFAIPIVCMNAKIRAKYLVQFFGAGIEIRPMIAGNIQEQPFFKKYATSFSDLPGATMLHDCGFYCGNYPELTQTDLETISSCLRKY